MILSAGEISRRDGRGKCHGDTIENPPTFMMVILETSTYTLTSSRIGFHGALLHDDCQDRRDPRGEVQMSPGDRRDAEREVPLSLTRAIVFS